MDDNKTSQSSFRCIYPTPSNHKYVYALTKQSNSDYQSFPADRGNHCPAYATFIYHSDTLLNWN